MDKKNLLLERIKLGVLGMKPVSPAQILRRVYVKPYELRGATDFATPFCIIKMQPLRQHVMETNGCLEYRSVAEVYIYFERGIAAWGSPEDIESDLVADAYNDVFVSWYEGDSSLGGLKEPEATDVELSTELNVPHEWHGDDYSIFYAAIPVTVAIDKD